MTAHAPIRSEAVAAQPPHATSPFRLWSSSRRAPHPFRSAVALDAPGVLLEGLRCCPAASPLRSDHGESGKEQDQVSGDTQ